MFEPKTYWERRAALNESLLTTLVKKFSTKLNAAERQELMPVMANYERHQQYLKDVRALDVLGQSPVPQEEIATKAFIEEVLKYNLGRAFYQNPHQHQPTPALEGSLGTAGYGKKFKDFLAELTELNTGVTTDVEPTIFKDTSWDMTGTGIPVIVLRDNDLIYLVSVYGGLSVQCLSLSNLPEDFDWSRPGQWRGEVFNYMGHMNKETFLVKFAQVLKKFNVETLQLPDTYIETYGNSISALGDVVLAAVATETETPAADEPAQSAAVEETTKVEA